MNILILNRASLQRMRYQDWIAPEHKIVVLSTADIAQDDCHILAELAVEVEYFDNYIGNGNVERRALELNQTYQFERIIAVNEFDLMRAAKLREILGLPGQNVASAHAFRDKILMKDYAKAVDVVTPTFARVSDPLDVMAFVKANGLPVVIKPISGGGSVDTNIIHHQQDLNQFLTAGFGKYIDHSPDYLIESFVDGLMYHVDGFVANGEVILCWPSRYATTCHALKNGDFFASYMLDGAAELTQRLRQQTTKLLNAFPLPEFCTFHVEFFHTQSDQLVFCEAAARTGGGLIDKMYQQGFGFDLNRNWINAQVTGELLTTPSEVPTKLQGEVLAPIRDGIVNKVAEQCDFAWATDYHCKISPQDNYAGAKNSNDTAVDILIEADTEQTMEDHFNKLGDWFDAEFEWDLK